MTYVENLTDPNQWNAEQFTAYVVALIANQNSEPHLQINQELYGRAVDQKGPVTVNELRETMYQIFLAHPKEIAEVIKTPGGGPTTRTLKTAFKTAYGEKQERDGAAPLEEALASVDGGPELLDLADSIDLKAPAVDTSKPM